MCLIHYTYPALTVCRYGSGTLTKVFVDRVFQECLTYDGEMVGYHNYLHNAMKLNWTIVMKLNKYYDVAELHRNNYFAINYLRHSLLHEFLCNLFHSTLWGKLKVTVKVGWNHCSNEFYFCIGFCNLSHNDYVFRDAMFCAA